MARGVAAAAFALAAVACLGGCVSLHGYPDTWEAVSAVPAGACPEIDGTYADTGESANGAHGASLASWLQVSKVRYPSRFDRIDLALSGDELAIRGVEPGGDAETRTLRRSLGEFECRDGAIELPYSSSCCFDMMSSHATGTLTLRRTPGYAVLGISELEAGILIVVPFALLQHTYVRFPRADGGPSATVTPR